MSQPAPLKYDAPFQSAYDAVLTSLRVHAPNLPVDVGSTIATDVALKFRRLDEGFAPLARRALDLLDQIGLEPSLKILNEAEALIADIRRAVA